MKHLAIKMKFHVVVVVVCLTVFGGIVTPVHTQDIALSATTQRATQYPNFEPMEFTKWSSNVQYNSTTMTNPKGMQPLYNLTTIVLDFFLGKQPIPDGYLNVSDMNISFGEKVREHKWFELVKHYWPILLVVLISAAFIAIMPIIGLCVCCCRCAGGCGGRAQPFDKKYDTCRRILFGFILIIIATGMVFSTIVSFATNYMLQQGIENATTSARYGVGDTKAFFRATSLQANHVLEKNYNELTNHLELMLTDTTDYVINKLKEQSKADSLYQLAEFADSLPHVEKDLRRIKAITNGLRNNATQLSDGLRRVKGELLVALNSCNSKACQNILKEYDISTLDNNDIDYDKVLDRYFPRLPDVSDMISSVHSLDADKIIAPIRRSQSALIGLRYDIDQTIKNGIPEVLESMRHTGNAMKNISSEIQRTLERISNTTDKLDEHFTTADTYIQEYYKYAYNFLLVVCLLLLYILLCLVFGLLCGICGKRPDGYDDDCCNKGSGTKFLILGVTFIFLTASILLAIGIVLFLSGLILHRGACVPLHSTNDDIFQNYIDKAIDLNHFMYPNGRKELRSLEPLRLSEVIESCHRNESIYKVLNLKNYFDIRDILNYPDRFALVSQLEELVNRIQLPRIEINVEEPIRRLAQSKLRSFDIDKYRDNLNEEITKHDLNAIAQKLEETAAKISSDSQYSNISAILRNQVLHLRSYAEHIVKPMTEQTKEMLDISDRLENLLKFNRSSFETALSEFITEINYAQNYINEEGTEFVQQTAIELMKTFKSEINTYLNLVISVTENELGKCGPLDNAYKSIVVAGCSRIVNPLNGLWAGIITSVLLFLPAIIFSLKLSTLYKKSDPYPGHLVESEYLYDAYGERDNIPLATGPSKSKRRSGASSSRSRRSEYYEDAPHHGHSSRGSSRDNRYNDMAPKHWNGGPPRYQNSPNAPPASEYERPPPYYFAGAPEE